MSRGDAGGQRLRLVGEPKLGAASEEGDFDVCKSRLDALRASLEPRLLRLSTSAYLSLEGAGAPESSPFQEAESAMFTASYTMRAQKRREGRDFELSTLEGLFWSQPVEPDLSWSRALATAPGVERRWKLLIAVPEFITPDDVERTAARLADKRALGAAPRITLERIDEGLCAQVLHVGPYATKQGSLDKLRELAAPRGFAPCGMHHEIYLSDRRRTSPEEMRTILRLPLARPERPAQQDQQRQAGSSSR